MRRAAAPAAVAGAALVAFLPALWAGFVADDFTMLDTVAALGDPLDAFARNDLGQEEGGHFYRPLWVLWNAAVTGLFGSGHAFPSHLLNLLLFAWVAVEVWALARGVLDPPRALIAGLLFALYPRHAESVAWVSGNTDLLAAAFSLGSLLCLAAPWSRPPRLAAALPLAAAAALSKEAAFVLPLLALLLAAGRRERRPWFDALALAGALALVLAVRTLVLDGAGGYGDEEPGAGRLLGAAASYLVAAFSPHQLEPLRQPVLLLVPAALALAGLVGVLVLRAREERQRLRVCLVGLGWFALALVPVLGQPLDLNNATGERLLFLPSVGLALAAAALLPLPRRGAGRLPAAAGVALLAALCVWSASAWVTASRIAERVTAQGVQLAPDGGALVLLSLPESYDNAHVFTNSYDAALRRRAGRPVAVTWCAPVHVRSEDRGAVRFRPGAGPGAGFEGTASWSAPFDFPVSREPRPLRPGCSYARRSGAEGARGLELGAIARPLPAPRARLAVFDGRELRPLAP